MSDKLGEKHQFTIIPGQPIEAPIMIEPQDAVPTEQEPILKKVGSTVKAYLKAAEELLSGKYAQIKDYTPQHLKDPGFVIVICCNDGVIIRYDKKVEAKGIGVGWNDENLGNLAPLISENVVYCHYPNQDECFKPKFGPQITLSVTNGKTGTSQLLSTVKIGFNIAIKESFGKLPKPPEKPYCLLSVQNSLELNIIGELVQDEGSLKAGQRFLTRTLMRLPVGWECIEVFPFQDFNHWDPQNAEIWAERDILASVLRYQMRESKLNNLDPNAAARKQFGVLLDSYKRLLDSDPDKEEQLQSFLTVNPILLFPAYVKMWPKLPIGANVTDFVFKDATGDYLLVELEKSTDKVFLKNGHTSAKLNHAHGQILDWKRYIEDNLSTVQRELGLEGISSNPKSIIVIGRTKTLTNDNRRKLISFENNCPKLKIMTYDDILENAKAIIENLLGPFWSESGATEIYYMPQKLLSM